jgi:hypothetical protein
MPKATTRNQGKTEFAAEFLGKNPRANANAVIEAWKSEGRDGTISATLVNKLRSSLGLVGNIRSSDKKNTEPSAIEKRPYTGKKRGRKPKNLSTPSVNLAPMHANGRTAEYPVHKVGRRAKASLRNGALEELDADIDRLLFKVMGLGGLPAIEETLRKARRQLYGAYTI